MLRPWNLFTRRYTSIRSSHRRRTHLRLEALEDRLVPAMVWNTNDSGPGSLRQAILDANNGPTNYIEFGIGNRMHQEVIHLQSALPAITRAGMRLDGRLQFLLEPDTNPPGVIIDGSAVHNNPIGLEIKADQCTVLGLGFQNFRGDQDTTTGIGIKIEGSFCTVGGCYLGTDGTGKYAAPNDVGIEIFGIVNGNSIGSKPFGENILSLPVGPIQARNIISGNSTGVVISGGAFNNVVTNDYIGTDISGKHAVPNRVGIEVSHGAHDNHIGYATVKSIYHPYGSGGSSSKYPNVISGNQDTGLWITDTGTTHNEVTDSLIGCDITGKHVLPNGNGIRINDGASYNQIGNTGSHDRNIIGGNLFEEVILSGESTVHNHVVNNYIGVDKSGAKDLANGRVGVLVNGGASFNTIGGLTSKERNVISGHSDTGVALRSFGTTGNLVRGNYIGTDADGLHSIPNNVGVSIAYSASSNTIGGDVPGARNVISGNTSDGVIVSGDEASDGDPASTSNRIWGNYIGTDKTGAKLLANGQYGIELLNGATNTSIGGHTVYGRNIISGNGIWQISINGPKTSYNGVHNNYIGLTANGSKGLIGNPFLHGGVEVTNGAHNNSIGGDEQGEGNIIADGFFGVYLHGEGVENNGINGNYIGTDSTGKKAAGNGIGIYINGGASHNVVGNQRRNVISGNVTYGVGLENEGTSFNRIANNYIGLDSTGKKALPNLIGIALANGVSDNFVMGQEIDQNINGYNYISGNSRYGVLLTGQETTRNTVGQNYIGLSADLSYKAVGNGRHGIFVTDQAFGNYIGGTSSETANTIANNKLDGILVGSDPLMGYTSPAGKGNTISSNTIYKNGKVGIDLGPMNGTTTNSLNAPAGPNDMLNHPDLSSVVLNSAGVLSITANFYTQVTQTIKVEMYANPPGTTGQGKIYLGSFISQATAFTISTFSNTLAGYSALLPLGTKITLTATDEAGNTSEFSLPMLVQKQKVKP